MRFNSIESLSKLSVHAMLGFNVTTSLDYRARSLSSNKIDAEILSFSSLWQNHDC